MSLVTCSRAELKARMNIENVIRDLREAVYAATDGATVRNLSVTQQRLILESAGRRVVRATERLARNIT